MTERLEIPFVPAKDEIRLAFADALDAWSTVEESVFQLFMVILPTHDYQRTWALFHSTERPREQARMVVALIENSPLPDDLKKRAQNLMDRFVKASSKRNKIVHGIWRKIYFSDHILMYRDYPDTPHGPASLAELDSRRKNKSFLKEDLSRVQVEFRRLAGELFSLQAQCPIHFAPKLSS